LANVSPANTCIKILLSLSILLSFTITFFVNQFPGNSYEVTDQNNEGIFSSLSRNFDKTIADINDDDKSDSSTSTQDDKEPTDNQVNSDKSESKKDDKEPTDNQVNSDKSETLSENNQNKKNSANSNITKTDSSEDTSLVNTTESVQIEPVDLKANI
jgi:hypothetical protein